MSMMADETTLRPGFRGKCLYKTGKCNNERALKTSGQAHNLCDEHRHRQNEHQRKLDAKNRYARKDGKTDDGAGSKDASPTNHQRNTRYMPYAKVRMSPSGAAPEDVHAMLARSGMVAPMPFHAIAGDALAGNAAAAAAASQMVGMGGATQEMLINSNNGGVVLAPHLPYPMPMQDFDGIIVPLPSYLEGHERNEIRARVFQKVMDFIAEECVRRYGVPVPTAGVVASKPHEDPPTTMTQQPQGGGALEEQGGDDASKNLQVRGKTNETTDSDASSDKRSNDGDAAAKDDEGVDDASDASRAKRATRGRTSRKDV